MMTASQSPAADLIQEANSAFVDEDFETALALFTRAIEADPTQADSFLKRAATHMKLSNHSDAVNDAIAASMLAGGNVEIAGKALLRKGMALFELKKFEEAREALEESKKVGCKDKILDTWISKVDAVAPPKKTTENTAAAPITPAATFLPPSKIRHEWFQNENFVTVTIFIKSLKKEQVTIEFQPRVCSVSIKLPTTEYTLELDPLMHPIIPSESKYSVLGSKVEIKLKKETVGIKWNDLEGQADGVVQTMVPTGEAKPEYPSSSKKKHDWDSVTKSVEEDKPEGEAALNALFQKIYKDASDETRRAMMKSYVESNGTCLSTNWDEVGKGKVPVTPPEGMVAKKFDM
ncbi:Cochaperone protein [Blyttiomyces sp. JEL0837]|nr:Cochaperone protein [Blyttiomyces sp. JEL0837]